MILHQQPLRTIYDVLSLTNSTPFTADTIRWCTKNPTSCTPIKSNLYLASSLAAALSEPALYSARLEHVNLLVCLYQDTVHLNGKKVYYIFHTINGNTSNTIKLTSE